MSTCPAAAVTVACLSAGVLLSATGCSAIGSASVPVVAAAPSGPPVRRVVQVSYGADATFAVCVEPACPKVTPKTLASENAVPARPMGTLASGLAAPDGLRVSAAEPMAQVVVTFASGSAAVTADGKATLKAALARYRTAERITVVGRTDSTGSASANKILARARATAVRDYLVALMPGRRSVIQVEAQGGCCFRAANDSDDARLRNRRVEVTFLGGGA